MDVVGKMMMNEMSKIPEFENFEECQWKDEMEIYLAKHTASTLMPFQKEAIYTAVKKERLLNAYAPGLGKTIQSLCCLAIWRAREEREREERERRECGRENCVEVVVESKYFQEKGWKIDLGEYKQGDCIAMIICPSYLKANWYAEYDMWIGNALKDVWVISSFKDLENTRPHRVKIVSYDIAAKMHDMIQEERVRSERGYQIVIMDECHYIKERSTKRFKQLQHLQLARYLLMLSGTPSPNYNRELYVPFHMLYPRVFHDYFTFANRYCDGHMDKFKQYQDRGSSNIEELACFFRRISIRKRAEDVLKDLPQVRRDRVMATCVISKKYHFLKTQFKKSLLEGDLKKIECTVSRMFSETCKLKVPVMIEYLDNAFHQLVQKNCSIAQRVICEQKQQITKQVLKTLRSEEVIESARGEGEAAAAVVAAAVVESDLEIYLTQVRKTEEIERNLFDEAYAKAMKQAISRVQAEENQDYEKTVLFVRHQESFQAILNWFEKNYCSYIAISGETNSKKRQGMLNQFLSEPIQFALLTIGSCATGFNIIPIRRMIFLELDWSPANLEQCECRIRRIGGAERVYYTYLLCEGTLDLQIYKKLLRKIERANIIVDDGRGFDFDFEND